jgi:putative oxidoreductase
LKFLDNYQDQAYALLRMVTGFLFLWHGTSKILDYPMASPGDGTLLITIAGIIELVGGILIIIGLFTRITAFLCSGTMAVAYWMVHASNGFLPIVNRGELAALYCFVFLFIATQGSGIWSLDKRDT